MSTQFLGGDERILGRPPGEAQYATTGNNPERMGTGLPTVSSYDRPTEDGRRRATDGAAAADSGLPVWCWMIVGTVLLLAFVRGLADFGPMEKAPWWLSHTATSFLGVAVGAIFALPFTAVWTASGRTRRVGWTVMRWILGGVTFSVTTFVGAIWYLKLAGGRFGVDAWAGLGPFGVDLNNFMENRKAFVPYVFIMIGVWVIRFFYRVSKA